MNAESRQQLIQLLLGLPLWANERQRREFVIDAIGPEHPALQRVTFDGPPATVAGEVTDALAAYAQPLPDGRRPLLALLDTIAELVGTAGERGQSVELLRSSLVTPGQHAKPGRSKFRLAVVAGLAATLVGIAAWALPRFWWSPLELEPQSSRIQLLHQGASNRTLLFVHGLYGEGEATFRAEGAADSWPTLVSRDQREMRAGPALSDYSIAVVEYPAKRRDRLSIPEIATRLVTDLADSSVIDSAQKIYIIAYSLGGLVTKELYLKLAAERPELAERIAGIFLIAVPSQGAPGANLLKLFPKELRGQLVADLRTIDSNTFLKSLESRWQTTLRQRDTTDPLPRIYCAYETQLTDGLLVVPLQYTATTCDQTPRAENSDHIQIVKPRNAEASIYGWVRGRIADVERLTIQQSPELLACNREPRVAVETSNLDTGSAKLIFRFFDLPINFSLGAIDLALEGIRPISASGHSAAKILHQSADCLFTPQRMMLSRPKRIRISGIGFTAERCGDNAEVAVTFASGTRRQGLKLDLTPAFVSAKGSTIADIETTGLEEDSIHLEFIHYPNIDYATDSRGIQCGLTY